MNMHLGEFEKLLLFALLARDNDAAGAALRRSIEDKTVHKDRRHGTNFWRLRRFGATSE